MNIEDTLSVIFDYASLEDLLRLTVVCKSYYEIGWEKLLTIKINLPVICYTTASLKEVAEELASGFSSNCVDHSIRENIYKSKIFLELTKRRKDMTYHVCELVKYHKHKYMPYNKCELSFLYECKYCTPIKKYIYVTTERELNKVFDEITLITVFNHANILKETLTTDTIKKMDNLSMRRYGSDYASSLKYLLHAADNANAEDSFKLIFTLMNKKRLDNIKELVDNMYSNRKETTKKLIIDYLFDE